MPKIAYIIPEFPGQTHIWMWREISHFREWNTDVTIFSTRRPSDRDRAKHHFVDQAQRETVYLWPAGMGTIIISLLWALITRPLGLLRCVQLGLTLPVEPGPAWRKVLPLIMPATILARAVQKQGITHLHSQSAKNSVILCMLVRRLLGLPYSLVVNANLEWWGGAMREKLGEADLIVTHAGWIRKDIINTFPDLPPDKVLLAPVGVDTHLWKPLADKTLAATGPYEFVSVGRLHPNKGHDTTIRAVDLLLKRGQQLKLRIIGGGPEQPALEALIKELDVAAYVELTGSLGEDDVRATLRRADLFVLPSRSEPLGVVYMEAMAAGVPVIGTTEGGVSEIVTSGEDGLLLPPDNPAALADAIEQLLADPERRQRFAIAGRKTIETRFDSRLGARKLLERFAAGLEIHGHRETANQP